MKSGNSEIPRGTVIRLAAAVMALFLASSCATSLLAGRQNTQGPLTGMIYNRERQSVSHAAVTLKNPADQRTWTTSTDINGRFSLPDIPYGPLEVSVSKELHENTTLTMVFSAQSQVLYAQIVHRDTLLSLCQEAFRQGRWTDAEGYLSRARALDPGHPDTRFLEAYLLLKREKRQEALTVLEALAGEIPGLYSAHLLLADIWEVSMKDPQKAAFHLEKALEIRQDPAWEARLSRLKTASEAPANP